MNERRVLLVVAGAFACLSTVCVALAQMPRGEVTVRSELAAAHVEDIRLVEGEQVIGHVRHASLRAGGRASMGFGAFEPTHDAHLEFDVEANGRRVRLRSRDSFEIHRGQDLAIVLDADFPVINRAVGPADAG